MAQFHVLRDIGQHLAIDGGWLCHLCAIVWFCVGYCVRYPAVTPSCLQDGTDLTTLGISIYEAFETALRCAEATFRPQLRVFNALLLAIPLGVRGPGLALTHYAETGTRVMLYDLAVGIVKGMRLHLLEGPHSGITLPRDPALPNDKPVLAWQILSRSFGVFVFIDSFAMAWMPGHTPAFDTAAGINTTENPLNIDYDQLIADPNAKPKPLSQLTDTTWEIHMAGMSKTWRKVLRFLDLPSEARTYERLLTIDAESRVEFDQLVNMVDRDKWDETNRMTWHALRSGWMQRFLRLHRVYLVRSIESESKEYQQSYDTCLGFATSIVRNHKYVIERYSSTAVARDFVPIYSHHLSAVIVLFIIGLLKPTMRSDMLAEIRGSVEVFKAVAQEDHVMYSRVGPKGHKVVSTMVHILESPLPANQSFDQLLAEVERQAAAGPDPSLPSAGNIASIVMNPMVQARGSGNAGGGASGVGQAARSEASMFGGAGNQQMTAQGAAGSGQGQGASMTQYSTSAVRNPAASVAMGAPPPWGRSQGQIQQQQQHQQQQPQQPSSSVSSASSQVPLYRQEEKPFLPAYGIGSSNSNSNEGMGNSEIIFPSLQTSQSFSGNANDGTSWMAGGSGSGMESYGGMGWGVPSQMPGQGQGSATGAGYGTMMGQMAFDEDGLINMDFDWDSLFKSF